MDYSKISNIVIENIDGKDAPDFVDAFIASADLDGVSMTDSQLEKLSEDTDFVYDQVLKSIY